jgi:alkylation response protein AidB-like acyl-CoA dehydrogenase
VGGETDVGQRTSGDTESLAAELAATAARYFEGALEDPHATAGDPAGAYRRLRPGLADLGWFGLPPEPWLGGTGAPRLTTPLFQVAGRALVPGPLLEDVVIGPALAAMLRSRRIRDVAACTPFAFVDLADAGGSLHATESSQPGPSRLGFGGVRLGGSGLTLADGLLTGTAGPIPHVCDVDWLLVAADSSSGPRLLLLAADHPGVEIVPIATMDPCSTAGQVDFLSPVGPDDILGTDDAPAELLVTLRSLARLALSAESHGIAAHLTDVSVSYALQRQQFGRATGSFQAVKHILAGMTRDVLALGNLVAAVASRLPADPPSMAMWCAIAKSHASQIAVKTAAAALQVHGGIGFTEEHSLQLYYKRALILESRFGQPAELNAMIGASRIAGLPAVR